MVSEGLASGNPAGHLFAIATTIAFAGITVVARWGGGLDMIPAACWGALFTLTTAAFLAGGDVARLHLPILPPVPSRAAY